MEETNNNIDTSIINSNSSIIPITRTSDVVLDQNSNEITPSTSTSSVSISTFQQLFNKHQTDQFFESVNWNIILQGLNQLKFVLPSPIQLKCFEYLFDNNGKTFSSDLMAQAKSGTGKTLVFVMITIMKHMKQYDYIKKTKSQKAHNSNNTNSNVVFSRKNSLPNNEDKQKNPINNKQQSTHIFHTLILVPTRELALQIQSLFTSLISNRLNNPPLRVHSFIGGTAIKQDVIVCKKIHVAIGTLGRIKQLISKSNLKLNQLQLIVCDEADSLFTNESYVEDVKSIFSAISKQNNEKHVQTMMFSATYSFQAMKNMSPFLLNPQVIMLHSTEPSLRGVKQYQIRVGENMPKYDIPLVFQQKQALLLELLATIPFNQCIIFNNIESESEELLTSLINHGYPSCFINNSKIQVVRNNIIESFRDLKHRILISSDLISRGVSIPYVSLVIHFQFAYDAATYIHRTGRAGRFGTKGISLAIIHNAEIYEIKRCKQFAQKLNCDIHLIDLEQMKSLKLNAKVTGENNTTTATTINNNNSSEHNKAVNEFQDYVSNMEELKQLEDEEQRFHTQMFEQARREALQELKKQKRERNNKENNQTEKQNKKQKQENKKIELENTETNTIPQILETKPADIASKEATIEQELVCENKIIVEKKEDNVEMNELDWYVEQAKNMLYEPTATTAPAIEANNSIHLRPDPTETYNQTSELDMHESNDNYSVSTSSSSEDENSLSNEESINLNAEGHPSFYPNNNCHPMFHTTFFPFNYAFHHSQVNEPITRRLFPNINNLFPSKSQFFASQAQ